MRKSYTTLAILCLLGTVLFGAKKIDTNFKASGKMHNLYYALPNNFDSLKKYPLVVGLHYCGGTGISYRNSLSPLADSLKMIVVCPDNSSVVVPDNELDIVTAAADSARKKFKIDTTAMFLTGMSCNGEFVFKHGMKKFYPFKGIFPWVPWIESRDFSKYKMDSDIPVVIAVGAGDPNYGILVALCDSLKKGGAKANLVIVPGVGHEELFGAFATTMINCIQYLNATDTVKIDNIPNVIAKNTDTMVTVEIKVTNKGTRPLRAKIVRGTENFINKATIVYNASEKKAVVTFKLIYGKKGATRVVVELSEVGGNGIHQKDFTLSVVADPSNIKSASTNFKTYLSPNPAHGYVNLTSSLSISKYIVYDILGKTVISQDVSGNQHIIDISKITSGLYFVNSKSENKSSIEKLYIQ
jgi:hypothetical protein